ncbi:two-component system response regulator [Streptomyces sp. NPDC058045]|uniref:response regulator n=1 Tax=Streptomyces sp. NPDC058045 TaxID=3346311 RepID=UPI0036ED03A0
MTNPAPETASILIVDDMEDNLIALEAVLGPLHQRLVRARSGEQALKAMLRQDFAVVLLDVLMPGMDGFETAANIKRLDQTRDVPVILLTGKEAGSDWSYRGYQIGVADFLTKPIDPWVLRTKVSVFLDLYRKGRQLSAQAEQLKRILVSDTTAAAATGAVREPRAEEAERLPPPIGEGLAQIADQLTQIELLLRDRPGTDLAALADRITDLERIVATLRAPREP